MSGVSANVKLPKSAKVKVPSSAVPATRPGPCGAGLLGGPPRPALGGGRDVHSDPGGVPVPRGGAGRVLAPDRWLVDGAAPGGGPDDRRAGHGRVAPRRARRGPPLRPRLAVHVGRVRVALPGGGCEHLDGLGGRLLRQRHVRELLRDARVRVDRAAPVPNPGRGRACRVRVHRRVIQPETAALVDRPCEPGGVRRAARGGIRPKGGCMNSVTTRGCRVSRAGAPPRPLEKRAARPRDARRTTPAWLFDTQTQFFFSNAKLSTKSGASSPFRVRAIEGC